MDFARVIARAGEVLPEFLFDVCAAENWRAQGPRIKQTLLYVVRQLLRVKETEMMKLMPAEEQSLQPRFRASFVQLREPLRHGVIIGVLSPESKFIHQTL